MKNYNEKRARRLAEDVRELVEQDPAQIDRILYEIAGQAEKTYSKTKLDVEIGLISDYIEESQDILDNWGRVMGISSGYSEVDKLTKGFVAGELIIVGAETSVGKTTFMCNVAINMALMGLSVLFVSLETDKPNLTAKLRKLAGDSFEKIAPFIAVNKSDELNWKSIDSLVANATEKMGVGAIFIDHLHYFSRELENVAEDLGRITKEMKKNAIRHKIPIILASHVRKASNYGKKKEVDENDLRGSSYIAQDADVVIMLTRSKDYIGDIKVRVVKNRNRGVDHEHNAMSLKFDGSRLSQRIPTQMLGPDVFAEIGEDDTIESKELDGPND